MDVNESKRRISERDAEALFKRYHLVLTEQGRTCSCCIEKLNGVEVEKAYLEVRQQAIEAETQREVA